MPLTSTHSLTRSLHNTAVFPKSSVLFNQIYKAFTGMTFLTKPQTSIKQHQCSIKSKQRNKIAFFFQPHEQLHFWGGPTHIVIPCQEPGPLKEGNVD